MKNIYQILLIVIIVFIICKIFDKINIPIIKTINNFNPLKSNNVYTYIEEPTNFNNEKKIQLLSKNNDIPIFFQLCIQLMKQKINGLNTNIVVLTPKNYLNYVDNFPIKMCPTSEYSLKFRVDLLSAYVLEKNGGLFLSPGTIVNNMNDILNKVNSFDVVTFGGSILTKSCSNNKFPSSFILGCKDNSEFIKSYKEGLTNNISSISDTTGDSVLADILGSNKYNQYHYCCSYDGTRNINNKYITLEDYLGYENIRYKNESNLSLISFPYHIVLKDKENYWFNSLSKEQFLQSNMFVSKLLKKLLKI